MQAVESETLILYQTDLRGQWPEAAARSFAAGLPYGRRLALHLGEPTGRASLAGTALALRALRQLMGRGVAASELMLESGKKPRLSLPAAPGPDFSISHSGPWVACAAVARGRIGLDVEMGTDARIAEWVVQEAALKATGEGLRAVREGRELRPDDGTIRWRGELWHVHRLDAFAGASACVICSLALQGIDAHAVAVAELFTS